MRRSRRRRRDPAEDHDRLVAALFDRPERPDRAGQVLAERPVAEVPRLLLPQPAELPRDLARTDALPGEHVLELAQRRDELTGLGPKRLDERPGPGDREVEAELLRPADEPRLEILAGDVDLPDLAERLHQLLESRRDLPAIGDHAREDERGVRIRRGEVAPDLVEGLLPERPGVVHEERPRFAEQRRRGQTLELPALPLGGVDLRSLGIAEERERRLANEEVVLSPEESHGRGRLRRHRSDSTVGI